jgi:hypothetical protein
MGTMTAWYSGEIGKTGKCRGVHTRRRRSSVSGSWLIGYRIIKHSSDLPDSRLMEGRDVDVLVFDCSAEGSTGAYH